MPIHNPGGTLQSRCRAGSGDTLQSGAVQVQEAHCKLGTGPGDTLQSGAGPGGTLQSKVQVQEVQ